MTDLFADAYERLASIGRDVLTLEGFLADRIKMRREHRVLMPLTSYSNVHFLSWKPLILQESRTMKDLYTVSVGQITTVQIP